MRNYYMLGDIHGDFKPVRGFYQNNRELLDGQDNVLICLGDFGANFFMNGRDTKFKRKLGSYPFTYFIVRGNHEERPSILMQQNPTKWHIENYLDGLVYVEDAYPYIKYASDIVNSYTIFDMSTLIIPGAYSVDKYHRIACGWSWFENEQLSQEEQNAGLEFIAKHGNKFDLVLSHTCPICFEPTDLFLRAIDQSTVDKTMERYLGAIEYQLDYKTWCWGHYHHTRIYPNGYDDKMRIMLYNDKVMQVSNFIFPPTKPEYINFLNTTKED